MIDRRGLMLKSAAFAAAGTVWGCLRAGQTGVLSARQLNILTLTADIVIPKTDTLGAVEAGVPAFVALALTHGLDGTTDPKTLGAPGDNDYGRWLETTLDTAAGGDFPGAASAKRLQALTAVDTAAFAPGAPPSPWTTLKGLILTGYYTSQAGGSQELQYQLVPGRWDPDIPAKPGERAWSSDWTAVEFG